MTSRFWVSNRAVELMDHVMKTFVTSEEKISDVVIRSQNDAKLRYI